MVTYSSLLENHEAFGRGEGFADAVGELSMVLEGPEEGFSINALYKKYRAGLVGLKNAELVGKDLQLCFVFSKPDDVHSIYMFCRNEDGTTCAIDTDSFVLLVSKDADCSITCGDTVTQLQRGQVALCSVPTKQLIIEPNSTNRIVVK